MIGAIKGRFLQFFVASSAALALSSAVNASELVVFPSPLVNGASVTLENEHLYQYNSSNDTWYPSVEAELDEIPPPHPVILPPVVILVDTDDNNVPKRGKPFYLWAAEGLYVDAAMAKYLKILPAFGNQPLPNEANFYERTPNNANNKAYRFQNWNGTAQDLRDHILPANEIMNGANTGPRYIPKTAP